MQHIDITGGKIRLTTAMDDDPFRKLAFEARKHAGSAQNLRRVASIPLAEIAKHPGILKDTERLRHYINTNPHYKTTEAGI